MRTKFYFGLIGLLALVLVVQHRQRASWRATEAANRPSASSNSSEAMETRRYRVAADTAADLGEAAIPLIHQTLAGLGMEHVEGEPSEALDELVGTITDAQMPVVLNELLAASAVEAGADLRRLLLRRWAERNPVAAAAWADQLPEGALRREAIQHVAIVWANAELTGALQWVQQMSNGETKQTALLNIGYEAARTTPFEALQVAVELPSSRPRDELLAHAASQWAATAPAAAAEWAGRIPDAGLREQILARIAMAWAELDPTAAAGLVTTALAAGGVQDRAVTAVVQRWAQQSPEAAANWVEQFPEIPLRETVVQNLIATWGNETPASPAVWLRRLPGGPLRDASIAAYVSVLAVSAREEAPTWIDLISDEARRTQSREVLTRLWPDTRH